MSKRNFDPEEWITRLGQALEAIAPTARYSVPTNPGYTHWGTYDEFRALKELADRDPGISGGAASSSVWLRSDPSEQQAILREHPVLRESLAADGAGEGLWAFRPNGGFRVGLKGIVSYLVGHAVRTTGEDAARLLHRCLTEGEKGKLEAREFVVIYGLKPASRIQLADSAFLAPLDDHLASEMDLSQEDLERLQRGGIAKYFREGFGGSAVYVRDLTWGPGLTSPSRGEEDDAADIEYCFPCDPQLVTDLLSVAARCPLVTSTYHTRMPAWMHVIDPNYSFGSWRGGGFIADGWWEERDLSEVDAATFKKLVTGWVAFHYHEDRQTEERNALELAIRRIASSFSRAGKMQLQDRILDYAIALEILYRLDSSELTYKLATRAAHLLKNTPDDPRDPMTTFEKITSFYDIRSAIVHGPTTKRRRKLGHEDFERGCADGRDLVCDTLSELLRRGRFPDWKRLVVEGATTITEDGSG